MLVGYGYISWKKEEKVKGKESERKGHRAVKKTRRDGVAKGRVWELEPLVNRFSASPYNSSQSLFIYYFQFS